MKEKPGVMLYFDRLPFLKRMDFDQCGRLFCAIMEYAQYAVVPEFGDPMLDMAWDIVRPLIDQDTERYEAKCERNRRNARKHAKTDDSEPLDATGTQTTNTNRKQKQTHLQKQSQKGSDAEAARMLRQAEERLLAYREEKRRRTEEDLPS